jgi:hypothetical protein
MAFIPDEAVDRMTELSAGALRLYIFLCRCRNQKTGKCFPSGRTSAEAIDVHPKNIFRLRNELAAAGWARFDADEAFDLLGFESSKNATTDVEPIEDADESCKNATIRAIGSKNTTVGSKNATAELQKRYSLVAKMLPNGSKNATPYKEEPAKEPAKITSKEEPLPDTDVSGCTLDIKGCYALFVELWKTVGGYEAPYQNKKADFVQLADLIKKYSAANWPITQERFEKAARNYFATPQGAHTLADLASRFSEFYKNAHNEFKRPTANGVLAAFTPNAQKTVAALESFVARNMAKEDL